MLETRRRRRGANAVEFALLLPLYLLLAFGTVDYGWTMYHKAALHAAAHHGCRSATLVDPGPGESDLQAVIDRARDAMLDEIEQHGPGCPTAGCVAEARVTGVVPQRSVVCRLSMPVDPLLGYVAVPTGLDATAVMRLEFQRGT